MPECTLRIDLNDVGYRDTKEVLAAVYKFLRAAVSVS